MIEQKIIDEIREKADIVQIISRYIEVIKKGNSYVAVCPFHNDTNPSMQISESKQIFKCFACGKGGNVFTFVQEYEKLSYIDAVKKVAEMISYHNEQLDKENVSNISSEDKEILNCLKQANEIYSYTLKTQEGEEGYNYLKERNISEEMCEYFNLGYCPKNGELSVKLLRSKDFSIEILDKTGIISRNNSNFIDRLRGRVIFPIYDEFNQVVGFSGRRIINNDEAKYVNSINNSVFNKSKLMYNYQNAMMEAKKCGFIYITEGFMDVFAYYSAGIPSCVCLMGTAFTNYHAKMLKKLNVEVRLSLDGDEAGQHGMLNTIDILDNENINYRFVDYRDCVLDPDEILQKYGKDVLNKLANRLISKEDFLISYFKKKYDVCSSNGVKNISDEILNYVLKYKDPIGQEILIKKLSELTSISIDSYRRMIGINSNDNKKTSFGFQNSKKEISISYLKRKRKTQYENAAEKIVKMLLNSKEAIKFYEENYYYSKYKFNDKDIYGILTDYIIDRYTNNKDFDINQFYSELQQKDGEPFVSLRNKIIELQEVEDSSLINKFNPQIMKEAIEIMYEQMKKENNIKALQNQNMSANDQARYLDNCLKNEK